MRDEQLQLEVLTLWTGTIKFYFCVTLATKSVIHEMRLPFWSKNNKQ